ncbi:hypothetical protein ACH40F_39230 [Streptomyces sp. NPDC020794]|uniref:hypothetical protein n=1 Tax=unclassified Streptomyces TaxID=2593676 RepID=UPI0036E1742B
MSAQPGASEGAAVLATVSGATALSGRSGRRQPGRIAREGAAAALIARLPAGTNRASRLRKVIGAFGSSARC